MYHAAVWMNRPRSNPADPRDRLRIRDLNVAIFPPFVRQDLDPHVVELRVVSPPGLLPVHLAVKVDRGGARGLRLTRHFQFGRVDGQPFASGLDRVSRELESY